MSPPGQPFDTAAARNPELDAALAGWSATPAPALAGKMREQAKELGLGSLLTRLSEITPIASIGDSYVIVAAADRFRLLAGGPIDEAVAVAGRPEITDLHRIVAVIYTCALADTESSRGWIVLHLAARTATDSELAARCYFHCGLMCGDNELALSSFISCRSKSLEARLAELLTVSALHGARSFFRLGKSRL